MITLTAPGSFMLFGEHQVLNENGVAIVAALEKRVSVTWCSRKDDSIGIDSALGTYETTRDSFQVTPPFEFVLKACECYLDAFETGFDLQIHSDFSPTLGWGSSAAVLAATLSVLSIASGQKESKEILFEKGLRCIRTIQGMGSGADLAASLWGKAFLYEQGRSPTQFLNLPEPIFLYYAGYKTKTAEVVKHVKARFQEDPAQWQTCSQQLREAVVSIASLLEIGSKEAFLKATKTYQALSLQLGHCDAHMESMLSEMMKSETVSCGRISGSGLGDCLWGMGQLVADNVYPISIAKEGVKHVL